MARSQETFNKKEKEKLRLKKRQEKQKKKDDRKTNPKSSFEDMIAYVDENGMITDTPPDPSKKIKVDAEAIEIGVAKRTEEDVPAEREGRVEFFNDQKGFGFIKESSTNEKYFVHINGLIDRIKEGDKVTYELERGMKGMNAINVKIIK